MAEEIRVSCPCCGSRLVVDVRTEKVVAWSRKGEADPTGRPVVREEDWRAARERVEGRLDTGHGRMEEALERERSRERDLDELFRRQRERAREREEDREEG